jgi:hypothetical protein
MARSVLVHGMRLATLGLMINPECSPCFGLRWCVKNHPKPRWDRELACECGAGTPCDYQRAKRQPDISKVIEWRHYDHRLRSRVPVGDGYRFAMSVSSPMSRSVQRLPTSTSAFATELEGSDETLFRPHEVNLKQRSGLMLIAQDRKRTTETDMSAAIARLLPRASATLVADLETLISTAIFCGTGLLLSLSVLILDKYVPGEWF